MNQNDLMNFLKRAIQPLKDRVLLMVGRALLTAINDSKDIQQVQLSALAGESMDKVERFQEFGFSSNPPKGSEAIFVSLGGNRENMVIIATEHRTLRFKDLASGEMAIYTDDGTFFHLKKNGQVLLKTATKVTVDAPDTEFTGNVLIKGDTVIDKTLLVKDEATFLKNINVTLNAKVTLLVQAGGYSGPAGSGAVVINVPVTLGATAPLTTGATMTSTADITTTGNVTGGGTNLASVKATFNSHTHPDGTPNSGTPNSTL